MTARALAAPLGAMPYRVTRRHAPRAARRVSVVSHGADRWIMLTVALLVGLSIVMVFNTSYFFAGERFGDPYYVFRKHLGSIVLGLGVCLAASRLRSSTYERLAYPLLAVVALALVAVLVPGLGIVRGGARRWIGLGAINVQPSELAKIAVVLYLARSIVRKGGRIETFSVGIVPHVIVVAVFAALVVVEPDFGTAALLAVLLLAMLFAGGVRVRHLVVPLLPALPLAAYAIHSSPYRLRRVMVFLDPWQHPRDAGFQLVQSFIAFGSGAAFGVGLGESKQKMFYLPEAHTDFIFSVIGEELGLVGALLVVTLFAALAVRGFRVALRHPTQFGRLVAFGVTVLLVAQAAVNMAVVLGLLPTKGLALPFVSYGGSAMIGALASVGVLLALSRESG
ncbi:MAG: putative lipid II flippase FtsW [Deltaproteobacteria bacterium]|nr:MAG: putative lipid II flippase FtsW [Deltaproteobacteria bacterium]